MNDKFIKIKTTFDIFKRLQINESIKKGNFEEVKLLDIGCGNGTDIVKWIESNIEICVGIDLSKPNIMHAISKYKGMYFGDCTNYKFYYTKKQINLSEVLSKRNYSMEYFNICTCYFTLQYFFESHALLNNLIQCVSSYLERGGFFIGIFLDGDVLVENLRNDEYESSQLIVRKIYKEIHQIGDCVDIYIPSNIILSESTYCPSYLVFKTKLIETCDKYGIKLIKMSRLRTNTDACNDTAQFFKFHSMFMFQKC